MSDDEAMTAWEDWKGQLKRGRVPTCTPAKFVNVMRHSTPSSEAIELAESDASARKVLRKLIDSFIVHVLSATDDSDVMALWLAVVGHEAYEDGLLRSRTKIEHIGDRASLVERLVDDACERRGRQWVRSRAWRWWREGQFLEEESDEYVRALLENEVLSLRDLETWGGSAVDTARRVTRRLLLDGREARWAAGPEQSVASIGNASVSIQLRERLGSLINPCFLPVDLRDGGLTKVELDRLTSSMGLQIGNWSMFSRAIERAFNMPFRHVMREFPWAVLQQERLRPNWGANGVRDSARHMELPLLRLMHLRLILESPSLADSRDAPELFLVPEVVQYLIGREYVAYAPELRIFADCERRWRARWVETTSEAASAIFLEDALQLDLTTLSRIPERTDKPTPDFRVRTSRNEPIVFETKGATAWSTHIRQRKKAMEQIGKRIDASPKRKKRKPSWAGNGRAFAMSFFAAMQGEERSSLLHVSDPSFNFAGFFDEREDDDSRRRHFAGVLEAAQLFELADDVLHATAERVETEHAEAATFTLQLGTAAEEGERYVGSYLPVQSWIRRLHHPTPETFANVKVFVGLLARYHDALAAGRLPPRFVSPEVQPSASEQDDRYPPVTYSGTLPSLEYAGAARGVFSRLADGALLAIELGT